MIYDQYAGCSRPLYEMLFIKGLSKRPW